MSSDTNVWKRLFDLRATIDKMIVDGARTPEMVADTLQVIVDTATYLRQLFTDVVVAATDGTESMPGLSASGHPTPATKATVWVMILDAMFAQLFGSLGGNRRRWSRSQVAVFVRDNSNKLRGGGYGNFFELEDGSVAGVCVSGGVWCEHVYGLSRDAVWHAGYEYRLISLQQAA